ncbi:MAG TPA: universal stress protein [Solirubrobacteraceae bacterium]|jgi:nucleotide-binding universal stress UspA family protein
MTPTIAIAVGALAAGLVGGWLLPSNGHNRDKKLPHGTRRILVPFTGTSISRRAFDAAIRLARVEDATIMPAYLARVPRHLPLDAPLPVQCHSAMPLLETIEQRATALGVSVDTRIIRGRTYRDALRRLLDTEHVDRVIVSATSSARTGLSSDDLEWLLEKVPAEVMILRPDPEDHRAVTAGAVAGHF